MRKGFVVAANAAREVRVRTSNYGSRSFLGVLGPRALIVCLLIILKRPDVLHPAHPFSEPLL